MSVRVSVHLFTFQVPSKSFWANMALLSRIFWYWCFLLLLTAFLPPLSEAQCANFLDFWNPWGIVMKEVVSDFKTLAYKGCKIATQKSLFIGKFCPTNRFFLLLVLLSASVERCFVFRVRDFFCVPT